MSKVGTDIKSLSRYAKTGGPVPPSADYSMPAGPEPNKAIGTELPAAGSPGVVEARVAAPDDLLSQEQNGDRDRAFFPNNGGKGADMPLFEPRAKISATGREKFANYFMAGHFTNLRPLRQEKRIIRNKAIIMSVLVIIALVWLFYFLYNQ
jgi:hypothetical protein